ncbi:MAG: hypothetical protein EA374_08275 [Acholeplasmatales bacterium]|nr:MAG: hypothetical protein EA374_08275 [Acholeplasmatales bacterium]
MKIYLMHQTHTDIGYTDRQEKITLYHIDYLKQAIRMSEAIAAGKESWNGFVWNNEMFWIIERFIEATDPTWHTRLLEAVRRGHIQLTANYLNMTDLVDARILKKYLQRAKTFGKAHDVRIDAAISMDINGWSYGYAQALADAGVRHFYTCIHNHHGFVPFGRKHVPFLWETPSGERILVWHGDVYNQGNVAKLVPDVIGHGTAEGLKTQAIIDPKRLAYAKRWLDDYIESVRSQGYDYDFLPLVTKGILVDNAPPNPHIVEAIDAFNQAYGDQLTIEMVGIHDFFDMLEHKALDLPVYKGDWTDWWSDGFASTPKSLMAYREAQRNYEKIHYLKQAGYPFAPVMLDALEYNLMMYAEHTWGYFTSVSEPWNKMTMKLETRNEMFAYKANELADRLLDDYQMAHGEMAKAVGRPMCYRITNPYPHPIVEMVQLHINWWEEFLVAEGYVITELGSDEPLPYQEIRVDEKARRQINVELSLPPFTSKTLTVIPKNQPVRLMPFDPLFTRDTTYDYTSPYLDNTIEATMFHLESPYLTMRFKTGEGVVECIDRLTGKSLVRTDCEAPLFAPIYEWTPVAMPTGEEGLAVKEARRAFGRNRKVMATQRAIGRLIDVKVLETGPLLGRVQLKYALKGTIHCAVELTVHRNSPRLDVALLLGKDTVWEPESMYLSLPFTTGADRALWLDKTGCPIRPRIDQLPGTLTAFYTTQTGYIIEGQDTAIHVAMPDSPLLALGSLEPGLIKTMDGTLPNVDKQNAWLMNNYWETNFATSLGGFYRFDFVVLITAQPDAETALEAMRRLSRKALVYQVSDYA